MARKPNPIRGEVEITLDGETFGLRPSYEAIVAMEGETGLSIIQLANAADGMALPVAKAAVVVTELVRAWGRAAPEAEPRMSAKGANPKRIGELLLSTGLPTALTAVAAVLFLAASGGYTPLGELKTSEK